MYIDQVLAAENERQLDRIETNATCDDLLDVERAYWVGHAVGRKRQLFSIRMAVNCDMSVRSLYPGYAEEVAKGAFRHAWVLDRLTLDDIVKPREFITLAEFKRRCKEWGL